MGIQKSIATRSLTRSSLGFLLCMRSAFIDLLNLTGLEKTFLVNEFATMWIKPTWLCFKENPARLVRTKVPAKWKWIGLVNFISQTCLNHWRKIKTTNNQVFQVSCVLSSSWKWTPGVNWLLKRVTLAGCLFPGHSYLCTFTVWKQVCTGPPMDSTCCSFPIVWHVTRQTISSMPTNHDVFPMIPYTTKKKVWKSIKNP